MNESIVPIYFFNFSKLLTKENGNYKIKTKTKKQKQKQTKQQHYLVHVEILFFSFKMNFICTYNIHVQAVFEQMKDLLTK